MAIPRRHPSLFATVALAVLACAGCRHSTTAGLEVFPEHFTLRPGETVHYQVLERAADGALHFPKDYAFESGNLEVLELRDKDGVFTARTPGHAALIVKSGQRERRYEIDVAGRPLSRIPAVAYTDVPTISGQDVLFVGHANMDGWDRTAVAKPGIDRLVGEFKRDGRKVVYWMSNEFPDWYTEDRQPDLAIISEGQEHNTLVDADRVVFTGGDFIFCLLRNVQMTLHRAILAGSRHELHLVFPADAIWTADTWGPGARKRYPAPSVTLASVWDTRASDAARYDTIVVPFLDTVFTKYPVLGFPKDAPPPSLGELIQGWNVTVQVGDLKRIYHKADSPKTIQMEFIRDYRPSS